MFISRMEMYTFTLLFLNSTDHVRIPILACDIPFFFFFFFFVTGYFLWVSNAYQCFYSFIDVSFTEHSTQLDQGCDPIPKAGKEK